MQIPFFNRWHPDLALRYLPVVHRIDKRESVLEVGSGSLGIGPYLKRPFIGVDINFNGPVWPPMERLKASALNIPKPDNSVDIVVSMDMLEHLPSEQRGQAIEEMLRLAKKKVIIGVPIGKRAEKHDQLIDQLYRKTRGNQHKFLKEQTEYGLPEQAEIVTALKKAAQKYHKNINITIIPNQNLSLRLWLMKGWINQNFFVNVFFRKILLVAIPVMRHLNQAPVYRRIFFITIGTHEAQNTY